MNLGEASKAFFDGYFSTHIRQSKTHVAYKSDLRQFEGFIGTNVSLLSITSENIERWVAHLKEKGYLPASIRRKIVVLKLFFSYWVRKGTVSESPFWRVQIHLGPIIQLPRALTETEMFSLFKQTRGDYQTGPFLRENKKPEHLEHIGSSQKQFRAFRDITILEVFFATGMRVGEVSAINVEDISDPEGSIRIHGKGGKERLGFVVDKSALDILGEYRKARNRIGADNFAFFLNSSGQRLSTQGIANIIKKLRLKSGIERHVTPHMLRHTVATMLLRNGVDIRIVQEFLGHASITTTQRYTHVSKEHMLRELRTRHPTLLLRTSLQ
jgi:integrase/recombinase XerD